MEILKISTQYSMYVGCFTFISGIIGNGLNILVFTRLKLFQQNRSVFYLTIESISSFLYQLMSVSLTILTSIYGDDATGRSLIWCRFRYIFGQTCGLVSSSMICFAACDQFISTNYRFDLRDMCTLTLTRHLTCIFICLWFIHSLVFGFFFDIQPLAGCVILNPIWLRYSTYFFYPVLGSLLPVTIASLFSFLAFRNVRRIVRRQLPIVRRRLDRQLTAMVFTRVAIFVCFLLPYAMYRIYVINVSFPRDRLLEYAISRLIQAILASFVVLNYTVSFYTFIITSPRYRRQVKFILIKKIWRQCKHWFCITDNQVGPENMTSMDSNVDFE